MGAVTIGWYGRPEAAREPPGHTPETLRRWFARLPPSARRDPGGILRSTTNRTAEAPPMPEFSVKEVRMPELHLPEIKRDEIVNALSGIHVPEIDRAMAEPRRRMRNVNLRALPWRQGRMAGVDAGKLIAAAVTAARIARP